MLLSLELSGEGRAKTVIYIQGQFTGDSHIHQPFRVKLQSQNPTEKICSSEIETDLLILLKELPGEINAQNYRARKWLN